MTEAQPMNFIRHEYEGDKHFVVQQELNHDKNHWRRYIIMTDRELKVYKTGGGAEGFLRRRQANLAHALSKDEGDPQLTFLLDATKWQAEKLRELRYGKQEDESNQI